MNWKNASEQKPEDGQEVLVNINGIFYNAVYSEKDDTYKPKIFSEHSFTPKRILIFWCEIPDSPLQPMTQ